MKNTLGIFEELVETHLLTPGTTPRPAFEQEQLCLELTRLRKELNNKMVDALWGAAEELTARRMVKFVQWKLVRIADNIFDQLKLETSEELELAMRTVSSLLEDLLELHGEYFNMEGKAPKFLLKQESEVLNTTYQSLYRKLKRNSKESKLPEVFRIYFQAFLRVDRVDMTYHDVIYARKLLNGIESMARDKSSDNYDNALFKLAVYYNFNFKKVLDCCKETFSKGANQEQSMSVIRTNYKYFMKELREMEQIPYWSYDKEHASLKLFVINILETELEWMTEHELDLVGEMNMNNKNFFVMDITVKQMILWTSLNVDLEKIPYHSVTQVLKVMTSVMRTLHPEPINYESARKKINDMDSATVRGLHKLISSQLRLLEEKYGHLM